MHERLELRRCSWGIHIWYIITSDYFGLLYAETESPVVAYKT